jgi:hypothetical protein
MTAELPPAIAFMLDEFRGKTLDLAKVRKKLNDDGFLRDFSDQCLEGIRSFPYADRLEPRLDKFDLYADGGLNPLSPHGKCGTPACRIAYAHHFARSACLYADRVVIPDPFSFGGFLDESPDEMFLLIGILKTLKPLLDTGIIIFGPAAYGSCSQCMKAVGAARRHVADQLWREFKRSTPDVLRFKYNGKWRMSFGSPLFTSDSEEYRMTIPATKPAIAASKPNEPMTGAKARELIRAYSKPLRANFVRSAHGVVFSARMGGLCRATVVTNTREDAAGYRLLDRRKIDVMAAEWERLRTIPLPALRQLTASQAIAVREEAEKALPAFRAKLRRDLVSLKDVSEESEDKRAREVAAELREAARELQGQLASVTLPSIRRSEKIFASLALALEIVALSTGNPAAMTAVSGTLAALLLAAHKSERDRKEKHELLLHQPAYVLLTAERVHAARH